MVIIWRGGSDPGHYSGNQGEEDVVYQELECRSVHWFAEGKKTKLNSVYQELAIIVGGGRCRKWCWGLSILHHGIGLLSRGDGHVRRTMQWWNTRLGNGDLTWCSRGVIRRLLWLGSVPVCNFLLNVRGAGFPTGVSFLEVLIFFHSGDSRHGVYLCSLGTLLEFFPSF